MRAFTPSIAWFGLAIMIATIVQSTRATAQLEAPAAPVFRPGSDVRSGKTVWEGVYSTAQAARGQAAFTNYCAACHGFDQAAVTPGNTTKLLAGPVFRKDWDTATANELFTKISTTMPKTTPGTLEKATYADLMAIILQANGYPAGDNELSPSPEALAAITIVGKEGPLPAATGSLVRVIGCLAQAPDKSWLLTNTTGAQRTRAMTASAGADLAMAANVALGSETVRVQGRVAPDPTPHAGHKMEAKGLLIKMPSETRIRVMWMQMLSEACAP